MESIALQGMTLECPPEHGVVTVIPSLLMATVHRNVGEHRMVIESRREPINLQGSIPSRWMWHEAHSACDFAAAAPISPEPSSVNQAMDALRMIEWRFPQRKCGTCVECCQSGFNDVLGLVWWSGDLRKFRAASNMETIDRDVVAITWYYDAEVKRVPCQWLKDGRCACYPDRPLLCRLFGTAAIKQLCCPKCREEERELWLKRTEMLHVVRDYLRALALVQRLKRDEQR